MSAPCSCAGPTFESAVVPLTFCDVCGRSWDSPADPFPVGGPVDPTSPARPMLILQPAPPAQDHCTHPRTFTKRRALSPAATTHCTSCGQTTPALPTPITGGDQ